MLKKIFILCAGKLIADQSTSLKSKHKQRVQRIGHTLSCITHQLDLIYSSSDLAAKETTLETLKVGAFDLSKIQTVDNPLDQLNQLDENIFNLLIVLTKDQLLDQLPSLWKPSFKKGTLLTLHYPQKWDIFKWSYCEIKNLIDAKQLPQLFPFISESGIEQRIRPAYYYQQSAVLPSRIENNQKEILLITTNSDKWGLPKGIIEPSLSAHTSAEHQAQEKAGIKGSISDEAIGSYTIEKWGAKIPVTVFPMQVHTILDEENWKKSNRKRQWYSIEEAKQVIDHQELIEIFNQLDLSQEK
jgi:phosphohistidine phosphatase